MTDKPIIDVGPEGASSFFRKNTSALARRADEAHVTHKGQIKPCTGAPMYPGAPTVTYFASCDEGCKWTGPVRQDSHTASLDLEQHMTDAEV